MGICDSVAYSHSGQKKAGVKSCVQDVQGRAVDNVNEIVILLFNAVKTKKGTLNRRLTVRKEEGTYSWDEGSMQFAAKVNGKIELVDSTNAVAAVEELNSEWIYLYLEEEYLEKFRQLFAFSTEIKDEFREEE